MSKPRVRALATGILGGAIVLPGRSQRPSFAVTLVRLSTGWKTAATLQRRRVAQSNTHAREQARPSL